MQPRRGSLPPSRERHAGSDSDLGPSSSLSHRPWAPSSSGPVSRTRYYVGLKGFKGPGSGPPGWSKTAVSSRDVNTPPASPPFPRFYRFYAPAQSAARMAARC